MVIACAGATGVWSPATWSRRPAPDGRPMAFIDLALPHDVDPGVADLPGVTLIDLADLADELTPPTPAARSRRSAGSSPRRSPRSWPPAAPASVTPTVVALRSMATSVVDAEMDRLDGRLPALDPDARAEILHTVRRVADKLLHEPTVRVKELANEDGAVSYAAALAELFALDPEAVDAVTRPEGLA